MANEHTEFWLALLNLGDDRRARLWNGYLGWKLPSKAKGKFDPKVLPPQLVVDPPEGGWPELTAEDRLELDNLATDNGGHPDFSREYMNFAGKVFLEELDLSGLILIDADFKGARFSKSVTLSNETQLYGFAQFSGAFFKQGMISKNARFHADAYFSGAAFESISIFFATEFSRRASFNDTIFKMNPQFDESKFHARFLPETAVPSRLADFRNARFPDGASFRDVRFGNDEISSTGTTAPERCADFSDAEFGAATTFRQSVFVGAPAFFDTTLHEDTDFGGVDWSKAESANISAAYTVRAWERLELMMSRLEKPLDRHKFFRLKMRARRRTEGLFLQTLNWLFEKTSDYGWGVGRAFACWLGHWLIASSFLFANSSVLFTNSNAAAVGPEQWPLAWAALGTGFANAHAFLFLTADGGHLEAQRKLLEQHDSYGILAPLGMAQALLGPILLFFLLLTLRNRFRLA